MQYEYQLNTVIGHSLDIHYKIPDIGNCIKPFDGFGIVNQTPVFWEAKFLREPKSFHFDRLEDHQIRYLMNFKKNCPSCLSLLLIGVVFGRGDLRVFYYTDLEDIFNRKKEKRSILKKEFLSSSNYVPVIDKQINFEKILENL